MAAGVPDKSAGEIRETLDRVMSCLSREGNVAEPPGLACNKLPSGGNWHLPSGGKGHSTMHKFSKLTSP